MEESISEVYNMLEVIREHIISSGTRVPKEKIFISRPKHTFVGEGPIILIYPEAPDRAMRRGDTNWWTSTYCWEFINIDVLVDDIYNDVSNSDAIRSQLEIKKELETMIYGDRVTIQSTLVDMGINVTGYRPNGAEDYQLENPKGTMVGTSVPLAIRRDEEWLKKAKEHIIVRHEGTLSTDESERSFVIEK